MKKKTKGKHKQTKLVTCGNLLNQQNTLNYSKENRNWNEDKKNKN